MLVLGVNAYHGDSAACLIRDGEILCAIEEERLSRIKHWAGFPLQAIEKCMQQANVSKNEIDMVAFGSNPTENLPRRLIYASGKIFEPKYLLDRLSLMRGKISRKNEVEELFGNSSKRPKIVNIEHHLAHIYSAIVPSGYDEALVVSIDGFGDFKSGTWGVFREGKYVADTTIYYPHSMGIFYQAMTQFIGFKNYGDEYKVMGLAPYGDPAYVNELKKMVHVGVSGDYKLDMKYFSHTTNKYSYLWNSGTPVVSDLFSDKLRELIGDPRGPGDPLEQRHKDIARSAQVVFEEVLLKIVRGLFKRHGIRKLCIAGGCAMNSVANGKIKIETEIEEIFVPASAGDAGTAIGAAFAASAISGVSHRVKKHVISSSPYLGPEISENQISDCLNLRKHELERQKCTVLRSNDDEIYSKIASYLSQGRVIGWFQGRMEWGPRALGNRSILGDPRRKDMKDILNLKIKRRESFRPFAPSILEECVGDWFEISDSVPYMMKVYRFKPEKGAEVPAVCHVDGSGRLQTVSEALNPRYYRLIREFHKITGVPMVLNTSFNENEPIVCYPNEALDCFLRTNMDVLVLENIVVSRVEPQ